MTDRHNSSPFARLEPYTCNQSAMTYHTFTSPWVPPHVVITTKHWQQSSQHRFVKASYPGLHSLAVPVSVLWILISMYIKEA